MTEELKSKVLEAIVKRKMEDPNAPPFAKLIGLKEDVKIYNALFGEDLAWQIVWEENK